MEAGENIIEVRHVTFTYLGEKQPALRDVNLTVKPGEFVLVLGPSASGKSTLVNLFNGSVPHIFEGTLEGEVYVNGLGTVEHPVSELAKTVGMVFQDPEAQLVNVLVKDEIYFGPENLLTPIEEIKRNAQRSVSLVGIEDLVERDVFQLSGGQKQKVAVASVLSMQPRVLVLDQPTANLDPQSTLEVFRLLGRLNRELGVTVIVIEHNVDGLAEFLTQVVIMKDGRVVLSGTPRQVFSQRFADFSEELGLWVPQISELAQGMRDRVSFPVFPLTVDEAYAPLVRAIKRGTSTREAGKVGQKNPDAKSIPIIDIRDLSYTYAVNGVKALDRLNLTIWPGDFLAIVGKNGSGKSTLAKTLMKINVPERDTVFIKGRDINDISLFELTQTIGYVFQNPDDQFVEETVFDEVAYSLRVRGIPEEVVGEKVLEVLHLFHLDKYKNLSPFSLSMGQRRLLSVATMLIVGQEVIILDEPTIGQDQASANLLMGYLKELNAQGKTITIITHDMRLMSKWVGRVVAMSRSHLVLDGTVTELFEREDIMEQAALVEPPIVKLVKRLRGDVPELPLILTPEEFEGVVRDPREFQVSKTALEG